MSNNILSNDPLELVDTLFHSIANDRDLSSISSLFFDGVEDVFVREVINALSSYQDWHYIENVVKDDAFIAIFLLNNDDDLALSETQVFKEDGEWRIRNLIIQPLEGLKPIMYLGENGVTATGE